MRGAASLEEAAELIVRYLYDHCIDQTTGERRCALARFYKTHQYGGLEPEQVEDAVGSRTFLPSTTSSGAMGSRPSWASAACFGRESCT